MFYRLKTHLEYTRPLSCIPAPDYESLRPQEYILMAEDITPEEERQFYAVLLAPKVNPQKQKWHMILKKITPGRIPPDIYSTEPFSLVSEKFIRILEQVDPTEHQYWPAKIVDKYGKNSDISPFYWLNIRKVLVISESDLELKSVDFRPNPQEIKRLAAVQNDEKLRSLVERHPLWKMRRASSSISYFNDELMSALRDAGISGIDPVTKKQKKWESLNCI